MTNEPGQRPAGDRSEPDGPPEDVPADVHADGPVDTPVARTPDAPGVHDAPDETPGDAPDDAPGARRRRRIRPRTTRAALVWIVVGLLVGTLVPAFALAAGTSAAADIVRDSVDSAEPITSGRHDLTGEGTYLIVGERGTTGQCLVTGPDGSSLDIELEEVFQAGAGTSDVSLGSFAAGSDGAYQVDCDAGGADLGLTRSPSLGGWSVLGGPMLVGAIGLVAGLTIGVVGLFGWVAARRRRWSSDS